MVLATLAGISAALGFDFACCCKFAQHTLRPDSAADQGTQPALAGTTTLLLTLSTALLLLLQAAAATAACFVSVSSAVLQAQNNFVAAVAVPTCGASSALLLPILQ